MTDRSLRLSRHLALCLALVLAALLCLVAVPARSEDRPVSEDQLMMPGTPESDGKPVWIDVSLFTTDASTPRPAVVLAHGFGGSKESSASTARLLARDGYAVLTYTARGFGRSGARSTSTRPPSRVRTPGA